MGTVLLLTSARYTVYFGLAPRCEYGLGHDLDGP